MMERYVLCILLSVILFSSSPTVSSVSHSHFFFATVTDVSTYYYYPTYYTTRSINDITLYRYDSNNEVIERKVPWFSSENSTLLDASIREFRQQLFLQGFLQALKKNLNDTEGFHMLQLLDGCVLYDNGTFDTLYSYRYDGKPFLNFNVKEANWTAEDPKAQYLTEILNVNETETKEIRNILVNRCVPHIPKLLSLGNCTFNRKEPPVVIVTQMLITNSAYQLNCRAYGHYPKNISMTWYKNGEPISESVMERVTLPLPDITYLTWLLLNITLQQDEVYTCSVTHSSLTAPLMAEWRLSGEPSDVSRGMSNGGIIALCMGTSVLVVLTVFGAVSIAKSRRQ